jgi:hypothetical protein
MVVSSVSVFPAYLLTTHLVLTYVLTIYMHVLI